MTPSPGFFAAQSAHLSLPGRVSRSWRARSLRACWRFETAEVIVCGAEAFGAGDPG